MKLSIIPFFVSLLAVAIGSPLGFPGIRDVESKAVLESRSGPVIQFNRGINIIKSYGTAVNGGFSAGKVVITGAVQAAGAIRDVFKEGNVGEYIVLAAYKHLQETLAVTDTGSAAVNAVFKYATWRATYGEFNGVTGATITAGIMLDTSTAILQLGQNDFDLLCTTIANYWAVNGARVNEFYASSGNAFAGFPTKRRRSEDGLVLARTNTDLQAEQVCARPIDMRPYFSNTETPQVTTTDTGC